MPLVRRAEARRTETPNAVMTTLASPTQGGAAGSIWRVEMAAGQCGPDHLFDVEQVWTVLAGSGEVTVDGLAERVTGGDTVVIPSGVLRRIRATPEDGLSMIVTGAAEGRATLPDGTDHGVPPWIA